MADDFDVAPRTQGPITAGRCCFSTAVGHLVPIISAAAYGSLLSQGRRGERMCVRILAAGFRPSFANSFAPLQTEKCRECRVRAAPAVSCAWSVKEKVHTHTKAHLRRGTTTSPALGIATSSVTLASIAFTVPASLPEQAFRKFCPIETQFSRTRFLARTTDGRWVRLKPKPRLKLKRSTRAETKRRTRITQGERPCFKTISRYRRRRFPQRRGAGSHHRFGGRVPAASSPSPPRPLGPRPRLRHRLHRWRLRRLLRDPPGVHPVRRRVPHRQRLLLIEPQVRFRSPGRPARPGFSVVGAIAIAQRSTLRAAAEAIHLPRNGRMDCFVASLRNDESARFARSAQRCVNDADRDRNGKVQARRFRV